MARVRKTAWLLGIAIAAMLLSSSIAAIADTVNVDDASGVEIAIEAPVERVVSIYGIGTYYFYALGQGDRVIQGGYIGVKTLAQAPPPLLSIEPALAEKMTFGVPNLEAIAAVSPDLIVVDATRHAEFAELAEQVGLVVLRQKLETPESIPQAMMQLANLFGDDTVTRASEYGNFADRLLTSIEQVSMGIAPEDRPSVLFLGSTPQRVASGDMLQRRMIELAGGICVSREAIGGWSDVDLEQIIVWNPDVMIVPAYAEFEPQDLADDPDWAPLEAVQSGRVYKMPRVMGPWDTAVPDFILGVLWMSDRFYPGAAEFDWATETAIFYDRFYDIDLPAEWLSASE